MSEQTKHLDLPRTSPLAELRACHANASFRNRNGVFFVEGVRNFVKAVDCRFSIRQVVYSEKLLINPVARKLVRRCRRSGVPTEKVSPETFRQLSRTKRASGVAALVKQRWQDLSETAPYGGLCWVVLERVNSPGNLGTLIRTSNAAGGKGFILVGQAVDPYAPDVIRAAMGAVFEQSFIRTNWQTLQGWVTRHKCCVIGAAPNGAHDLHSFKCPATATPLLMLGEERKGLTDRQTRLCQHMVKIPMQDGTDSLNLGVAGSLIIYEMLRHRRS